MPRCMLIVAVFFLFLAPQRGRSDAFDRYTNSILEKASKQNEIKESKQLTPSQLADSYGVIPHASGALLIVKTNEGRISKLLVQAARQRMDSKTIIPILLIDRFVTFREGEDRTVQASGSNLDLFPGFHLNLDIGQVVPEKLGGDLRFVADGDKIYVEPVAKAQLFLVTKALPGTEMKKAAKLEIGDTFEPRFFNGTYKLQDDGRRSGTLTLKIAGDGEVTGSYYSDKDGQKYEVLGKIGTPKNAIQFTIKFPRSEQTFQGWLFTGNGQAITGSSRLQERETGFYALRSEEE